jgi:hypothetical protein
VKVDLVCFSCHKKIEILLPLGRRDECTHCGADLRVCLNCNMYDKGSHHECREPSSDWVKEKDRANYCDYFMVKSGEMSTQSKAQDLKAQAEALFKKQS